MRMVRGSVVCAIALATVFFATPAFAQQGGQPGSSALLFAVTPESGGQSSPEMYLLAKPMFAQQGSQTGSSNNQGGIGIGAEFGYVNSNIHVEQFQEFFHSRNGWMAGIWFGGNRAGLIGFMGEITYVVKGAKIGETGDESDLQLHYLEIPAVFRINLGSHDRNGLCVYPLFGPVVDIQLKGELDGVDIKDQFNGFDVGLLGGVGVEFMRIGIEARGNWGLKSLVANAAGDFGDLEKSKNFQFQLLAKIRFN
jgi:hypothetical protein